MVKKEIKDILTKQLELPISVVKAKEDDDNCTLTFIGSDETVDRYGDIVKVDGWELQNYKANPVFLWAHNSREMPIGKATKVWVDDEKLKFKIQFAVEEYPFAKLAYDMYKGGYLNATSVGFIVKDWKFEEDNFVSLSQELLELSAVPVPANPAALRLGFTDEEIDKLKAYQVEKEKAMIEKGIDTNEKTVVETEPVVEEPQIEVPTPTEEPVVEEINKEDEQVNEQEFNELKELVADLSSQLKELTNLVKEKLVDPEQVEDVVEQPTVNEQTDDVVEATDGQNEKTVEEEPETVETETKTVEDDPVTEEPVTEPEVVEQPKNNEKELDFTITIEDIREILK